ncbi:DUF3179 domain-containing protein [Halomonas urmiana]|uniref:DUF3179 domain-containing protein n=1 Tax=Halomonas urmiana TaxID=490901 RepID=A0A5R8MIG8_9GAMM|nr:DUF3179 domain-containing protein [Halomonas urmiana]TLF51765.1 DUF3179 domain-containing protein [Halomonas urmiana]
MSRWRLSPIILFAAWLLLPLPQPLPEARAALPTVEAPRVPLAYSLQEFRQAVRAGGPGKDGIPSIDRPRFHSASEADALLEEGERVIGLYLDGEARAYPQRILVWHEIVNDTVGGRPVSITYCPLTGSALGFHRGDAELGVSGRLVNSNLVMYDRITDSEIPQMLGVAIDGPLTGRRLDELRVVWTTWGAWKARHPETRVLNRETGHVRNYRRDPYGGYAPRRGYYRPQSRRLFPVMTESRRLPPKASVLGFRTPQGAAAVTREAVIDLAVGDSHYTVIPDAGLATGWVFHNPRRVAIRIDELTFGPAGVSGGGTEALEAINAFEAMWFAWAAFYPETLLYGAAEDAP